MSVEAAEQNNHQYGRVERQSHPELSPDALKITSQYGNIEQYPLPVNFYGTNPITGEDIILENVSEKTIDSIIIGNQGEVGLVEYD